MEFRRRSAPAIEERAGPAVSRAPVTGLIRSYSEVAVGFRMGFGRLCKD